MWLNGGHKLVDEVVATVNCLDGSPLSIDLALWDNVLANESWRITKNIHIYVENKVHCFYWMNAHASISTYAITERKTETDLSLRSAKNKVYKKSQLVHH